MRITAKVQRGRPKSDRTIELEAARKKEEELLKAWLSERVRRAPVTKYTKSRVLYADYLEWCEDHIKTEEETDYILNNLRFGMALSRLKYYADRISGFSVHRSAVLRDRK